MTISETVLEMHYHHAIMDAFRQGYHGGVGGGAGMQFYKYVPQKECLVGFDQAYVRHDLAAEALFDELVAVANGAPSTHKFFGVFLQFKVVRTCLRRTRHTPATIQHKPHFRVDLDTTKNARTGMSQHELLVNLSRHAGSATFYACPMLFERERLYSPTADLNELRLVDVDSCPSAYSDNDQHFIYFARPTSVPLWCSEPVAGTSRSVEDAVSHLLRHVAAASPAVLAAELLASLRDIESLGLSPTAEVFTRSGRRDILELTADSMTIFRIAEE